jgi:hypothetical protein
MRNWDTEKAYCKSLALYCLRHKVINAANILILSKVLGIVTKCVLEDN